MSSPSAEKIPAVASPILQGMGLMVISTLLAPGIDIFAKLATDSVSPGVITLARFVFQALFMLPLVIVNGSWRRFSIRRSLIHAVRAAVIVIAMVCFVTTLAEMAVADAIAIFFVEPIILTVLASIFLGETIGCAATRPAPSVSSAPSSSSARASPMSAMSPCCRSSPPSASPFSA
jgi:EamA domain-containing membrane protein RarD